MTGDALIRDEVVRVAAYTVTTPWIENLTFQNCQIIGPAVLALVDRVEMSHCSFEADLNALFWEVPHDRPMVLGAVGVRDVTFSRCTFQAIGFAGPPELRAVMEQELGREAD